MAPPSYHPDSVTLTLRTSKPVSGSNSSLTRNVILRPEEPVVVGRSSRSEIKNLSASVDNTLFDCPVISRRHAELVLKVNRWAEEKYQIELKDTGSMHGTSVNGVKLQPSKPFSLRVGDKIRLGDSVNRAENNYDGVTITIDCISTANHKSTAQNQVKSGQTDSLSFKGFGFSYPSESELGCGDDDEDEDEEDVVEDIQILGSTTHTMADQPHATVGYGTPSKLGSSSREAIMLDEDEVVVDDLDGARGSTSHTAYVPDTYADDTNHPGAPIPRSYGFAPAYLTESGARHADDDFWANEDEISDGSESGSQLSNEDDISRAGADYDSNFGEPTDVYEFHSNVGGEEDDNDEGPEVMTSKRAFSVQIGSLGDEPNRESADKTYQRLAPRQHYDPVRGFQDAPATMESGISRPYDSTYQSTYHDLHADVAHSSNTARGSKWDVEPDVPYLAVQEFKNPNPWSSIFSPAPEPDHPFITPELPTDMHGLYATAPTSINETAIAHDKSTSTDQPALPKIPEAFTNSMSTFASQHLEERSPALSNRKRKATQISTDDDRIHLSESADQENKPMQVRACVLSDRPECDAPRPTKRSKPERTQKSMLRTVAIEAGKYTAGAIIGGIGLVTLLASPIGEALANC